MITREKALALLRQHGCDEGILRHSLAAESVLRALAARLEEDEALWSLTGLLHDLDYATTKDSPQQHGLAAGRVLEGELPEAALTAIAAHNGEYTGVEPKTAFDYALRAGETVTGLIAAAVLVRPTGYEGLRAASLRKKMKDRAFAASVDRGRIRECEKLGLSLDEFLELAVGAMAARAENAGS